LIRRPSALDSNPGHRPQGDRIQVSTDGRTPFSATPPGSPRPRDASRRRRPERPSRYTGTGFSRHGVPNGTPAVHGSPYASKQETRATHRAPGRCPERRAVRHTVAGRAPSTGKWGDRPAGNDRFCRGRWSRSEEQKHTPRQSGRRGRPERPSPNAGPRDGSPGTHGGGRVGGMQPGPSNNSARPELLFGLLPTSRGQE